MTIDITKPLELSDGTRVVLREGNNHWIMVGGRFGLYDHSYFEPDGTPHPAWKEEANGRTLRNVKESLMERTSEECLQSLERLARRIAEAATVPNELGIKTCRKWQDEAREIVAELDKQSYAQYEETARLVWNDDTSLAIVPYGAKCIAKGRELALAERKVNITNHNPTSIDIASNTKGTEIAVALKPIKSGELRRGQ